MTNFLVLFYSLLLIVFSQNSAAETSVVNTQCSVSGSGNLMYSRFYSLWTEDAGVKNGYPTAKGRDVTSKEKAEALDCLQKADALNNCKAIHVLELFYRFGISEKEVGIRKDLVIADKYLNRKQTICPQPEL